MINKMFRTQDNMTANPSKYPQGYFKIKPCKRCKKDFQPVAPSHLFCSTECTQQAHANRYYKKQYNTTYDVVDDLHKTQKGVCAICGDKGFSMAKKSSNQIVVDHDHLTGKVRGLLCHNCNRGLGLFKDSAERLQKAMAYLNKH